MPADLPVPLMLRAYRDGDDRAILALFARAFPHAPRSGEHFRWKYKENPFGNAHISLAFAGAQLVGHYSGYPVPFRIVESGRSRRVDLLAHQIGDTMTDVSVRHLGRGPTSVLGRTALHFYETFCEGKVAFNYGFNVANIQKFSLRFLRSDRVEPVPYRVASLLPPIARHERWLRGYSLEVMRDAGREFDAFFERVGPAYRFCVTRNSAYIRWRYLERPDLQYVVIAVRKWRRLVGWIVYRVIDDRLVMGDALVDPDFSDALEVALRHLAPRHVVKTIEGWFPPRPRWLDAALASLGFVAQPEPNDLSLMCVPFTRPDIVERMRADLYYTAADSDLF
jgi:hypothetical protein